MHSGWFSSIFFRVLKILHIKEGRPNFSGELILQKVWIIWSTLLYFNFKSFTDPKSSSFIRYQCLLHYSGVLFWASLNFYKEKWGDLISGGNQFCWKSELFGPPFCISILKVFQTQILRHSLDLNAFCMIQGYFSQSLEFLQIKEGRPNFFREPIFQKVRILWSPLLYFNFNSFTDGNSSSIIRFQYIFHDSGILFSESWSFYNLKRGDLFLGEANFAESLNYMVPPSVFQF